MLSIDEIEELREIARIATSLIVRANRVRAKYHDKVIEEHPELYSRDFLKEYYMLRAFEEEQQKSNQLSESNKRITGARSG